MFEAAVVGSLLAGGPLVAILGMAYNLSVLGPTSLLGSAVFILFYPTMVSFSVPVWSRSPVGSFRRNATVFPAPLDV